jgi:C_GCAxxG_C_C family probable redox protein
MTTRPDRAEAIFRQGFSCSQAVLAAFADSGGLDVDRALRLGNGFAAGMCGLGRTCGAVSGGILAIGLLHGRTRPDDHAARDATSGRVRRLTAEFRWRHGTLDCRALLGCRIDTAEKRQAARDAGLFLRVCPPLVRSAAEIVEQVLAEQDAPPAP